MSAASPRTEPPRTKGERTQRRILDAAERRFADQGFEATRLRQVADDVGVRVPSLYNHFESKEALYRAVLERAFRPMLEVLDEGLARGPANVDPDPVIDGLVRLLAEHPEIPRLVYHEGLAAGRGLSPPLSEWVERLFAQGVEVMRGLAPDTGWSEDELALLELAMNHVFLGYFSLAGLYGTSLGFDPLSEQGLERQARFLKKLWRMLWDQTRAGSEGGT